MDVFSPWGSGKGELGRERPEEGNPSGPMSFALDGKGRMSVLDQINGRVVRYGSDGKVESEFPIDRPNAQDVAVADDGTTAVLDRFGEGDVALYDENGDLIGTLPLAGEGIDGPGHVTGVFVDGTDVYAEHEHGPLVKLGDTSGKPADPREQVPGRPTRDGTAWIKAGITDGPAGRAYVVSNDRPSGDHRFTREIRTPDAIRSLVLLDSDLAGAIYLGAEIEEGGEEDVAILLVCLDQQTGVPTGTALLPANTMPEESFRDFNVLDGGGVVYAHRTDAGTSYEYYACE